MTDGHGVYPEASREEYARRLLTEVEIGNGTSQRSLARRAGVALGLTNVILKSLVRSGWVQVAHVREGVRYEITPEGVAEKTRMSTAYFAQMTRFYVEARDRIRERLSQLSHTWPAGGAPKRVAFCGATEVGEIGHVCVQETDLSVTAIFDHQGGRRFFGLPVREVARLADPYSWTDFDVLIVMSFDVTARRNAEAYLNEIAFPPERVFWI